MHQHGCRRRRHRVLRPRVRLGVRRAAGVACSERQRAAAAVERRRMIAEEWAARFVERVVRYEREQARVHEHQRSLRRGYAVEADNFRSAASPRNRFNLGRHAY